MSSNHQELLSIIRESENPERSLCIAIDIIASFLEQPESFQSQIAVCPLVLG